MESRGSAHLNWDLALLERESQQRCEALEQAGKLPHGFTQTYFLPQPRELKDPADLCQFLAPLGHERRRQVLERLFTEQGYDHDERETRRMRAALEMATDAATFVALAKGEAIPLDRTNPRFRRAHKRRKGWR